MNVTVHVYLHDDGTGQKLDTLLALVKQLQQGEVQMASDLTALTDAVAKEQTVDESAIALLNGLSAQIASLKNDPVALQALADSLNANSDSLAAAVTANTGP